MRAKPRRRNGGLGRIGGGAPLILAVIAAALALAAPAAASKELTDYFGSDDGDTSRETAVGGELLDPRTSGANADGAGPANAGDVYVVDGGYNRIQRFDVEGNFISTWGADVALPAGGSDFEICTVASECIGGIATGGNGTAAGNGALNDPQSLAVDNDTGDVYVSDRDNRRVNVYDGAGDFIRSFGWDVAESGPGDTGVEYEVCEHADGDVCKAGVGAAPPGPGQFHTSGTAGAYGIAVSPPDGEAAAGKVFLANSGARRIETFSLDGTLPAHFGSATQFGTAQPAKVAVDSRGIVYASDASNSGEIERYDSEDANGGGIGFLEPIGAGRSESQTLQFTGFKTGGDTFTLTCPGGETTAEITWQGGFSSSSISAGLEAACGAGNFEVSSLGNLLFRVDYRLAFSDADVPQMICTTVSGAGTCKVSEEVDGKAGTLLGVGGEAATAGLAVDPDSDGGGPDADVLYALRVPGPSAHFPADPPVVQQLGPHNAPGMTAAPTADDERHGAGAGFTPLGLGFDQVTERLFVSSVGQLGGLPSARRLLILEEIPAPEATVDPVTDPGPHTATFSGTVDANGGPVGYHFEYADDAEFTVSGFEGAARTPLVDRDIGNGEDPVAVEDVSRGDLLPGTLYHVRLVAKRIFSPAQVTTAAETFTTPTSAPMIAGSAATVGLDEATLRGAIDPEGEEVTDYHFEWGADAGYGNTTPVGNLALGTDPVAISAELAGLTPGQTYHYRLLATNARGTAEGPDRTFTTYSSQPGLGPERSYELVSHYPTGGVPIISLPGWHTISEDGDRVALSSESPLPGSTLPRLPDDIHQDPLGGPMQYRSVRSADGWRVSEVGVSGEGWSSDARRLLVKTEVNGDEDPADRLDSDDQNKEFENYDLYQVQPDGTFVWITRDPRIPEGTPQTAPGSADLADLFGRATMSADGRTVVFSSQRQLDDADTTPAPTLSNKRFRLYKWTAADKGAGFIGARPDGSVPENGSVLGDAGQFKYSTGTPLHAVSRDGSRVVFGAERTDGGPETMYVQTDGAPTVEAVKETGVPRLPDAELFDQIYRGASTDASRVFFTTNSRLTPDSGGSGTSSATGDADLYVYDLAADKVRDLTPRLDGIEDPDFDPASVDRGRALGLAANSEDGRRVYFVADAQYDTAPNPRGELPAPAGRNLYLAELDGIDDPVELRFVAGLGADDEGVWTGKWEDSNGAGGVNKGKTSYASPDGSVLGFASAENLTGQSTGGKYQLFVYDAEADTLECASCPSDGSLPAGHVNEFSNFGSTTGQAGWQAGPGNGSAVNRWVSSKGAVFFYTATALVPEDENVVSDVYEYRAGELRLVSTGTGTHKSALENASRDGSTVLINTQDALVPEDTEPGVPKVYAARVGGGFPFVPEDTPCDLGAGACEGEGTSPPALQGAGTAVFRGSGNSAIADNAHCGRLVRNLRRLSVRSRGLRRAARRTARAGNRRRARRLRRRARRTSRAARKRSAAARRCRRAARAANADRRAVR